MTAQVDTTQMSVCKTVLPERRDLEEEFIHCFNNRMKASKLQLLPHPSEKLSESVSTALLLKTCQNDHFLQATATEQNCGRLKFPLASGNGRKKLYLYKPKVAKKKKN
ncbi:hypothetical protein HPB50_026343 [Hyalomma asiaticum]|uniref:Uncharacterized protein n=1 Tax=Hyalomma asiaticum TaxID=266040 RepID=A0ACB7T290_HYAAI|nr:hypothetical protein HPB50_026343 [Hyalomma asiaticum]